MNNYIKPGPSGNRLSKNLIGLFYRGYPKKEIVQQVVGQSFHIGQQAVGYLLLINKLLDIKSLMINKTLERNCATSCCTISTVERGVYEKT